MPDMDHRIAAYWLLSALGFGWLAVIAVQRFWRSMTRPRIAIVFFAVSWCALMLNNFLFRTHIVTGMGRVSESVRFACCASLLGLIWEFRERHIVTSRGD